MKDLISQLVIYGNFSFIFEFVAELAAKFGFFCGFKLRSVTRDTRHATATTTLFATHVFLCMCSVRRDKRQVARNVSLATFGFATCSD